MKGTAEAVVVGGGVMGCSILYNLAVRGMTETVLVERDTLGSGSTGRSSAVVRMHYSMEVNSRLAWESLKVFQEWKDRVGAGDPSYVTTGIMVFVPPASLEALEATITMQESVGIDTRIISNEEAKELAPYLSLDGTAGIAYEPQSGYADPTGVYAGYIDRARELGAEVVLQAPCQKVDIQGDRVRGVVTPQGRIDTPIVVLVTGPWSAGVLKEIGIELPLKATRAQVMFLKRGVEGPANHVGAIDLANLTYFRPDGNELTLVGNGKEEEANPNGYDQKADMDFIQETWGRVAKRVPALAEAELFTSYAGLYTVTPDSHPVIDKVDGIEGLYICTGFSGHGFKLSPATGIVVAELILEGKARTVDISPLRMSRFREGDLNKTLYPMRVIA
ncbi:MAG: FAD-binding oxidoreductase [Dehalococcoidia bacterium]